MTASDVKLLPREPDDGMIEAGQDKIDQLRSWGGMIAAADVYEAMWDAHDAPEQDGEPFVFSYRNYRGEVSTRSVRPIGIRFGATEWHPEPQWLLCAFDLDKQAKREFAVADIGASPESGEPVPPFADGGYGSRLVRAAENYINEYELDDGDGGYHSPTEFERALMIDMINGLFAEEEFFGIIRALASTAPPSASAIRDAALEELAAYREAAEYDALMEGPRFKGWNRSQLDRARKLTEAARLIEGDRP